MTRALVEFILAMILSAMDFLSEHVAENHREDWKSLRGGVQAVQFRELLGDEECG